MKNNKTDDKIILKLLASFVPVVLGAIFMTGCGNPIAIGSEDAKGLDDTKKIGMEINDAVNGMFITMTDEKNPVLLFISGGPGVPEVWLNEAYADVYPNKIAEHFTVCYWDYYGEGLSYDSDINPDEITIERLAYDAHAVAEFLKKEFKKEKIYLMGHSSGTNLGLYLAQTNTEDFYCYFGMGQAVVGKDSVRRYEEGYYFMKELFEKEGNTKALRKMNKLVKISEDGEFSVKKPSTIGKDWEKILLMAGCATTRDMRSDAKDIFFKQMGCKCYTVKEKINFWRGKTLLGKTPYSDFTVDSDLPAQIPVAFLSGYYDYTTPITLSKELYEKLEAPEKSFYTFYNSAHSPLWEENELTIEAMLNHVREE